MAGAILNVDSEPAITNMVPGITYTPPSPPAVAPAPLPVTAPVLGLNLAGMTVLIFGDVRASTSNPALTLQVHE